MGNVDFDPGPGSAPGSAFIGSAVLSLSNDGAYRWVRAGGNTVAESVSVGPDDGILASGSSANPTAWDSAGNPVFTLDLVHSDPLRAGADSSAAGIVVSTKNEAHCPGGYEVQRFAW
jgi:hypothetical protein